MVWQFIILGARGLIPWTYSADYSIHAVPEIWAAYLDVIAEINELMSAVLADDVPLDLAIETTFPTTFDYLVKQDETATWIFSVSTNEHSLYVTYDLSAIGADLCVVDYTTGEVFTQGADGKATVPYGGLQVRLLEARPN
jgi:formylmethanofuran dehydrogenase subunit A